MKTYQGSCHCGKVRFEATMELTKGLTCNCSICSKKGYVLEFIPTEQFKLLSGEEALTEYLFNKEKIHHLFCSTCGIESFARADGPDGKEMYAINLRCLQDVDLSTLSLSEYDGKSI